MPGNVLIVDDDASVREALSLLLDRAGYATRQASRSSEALASVQEGPTQVVLLDLRLGDESGLALLPRLKALRPEISVIVLTALAAIDTVVEAMKLGADNFVVKPVDPPRLIALVGKGIEAEALRSENARLGAGAIRPPRRPPSTPSDEPGEPRLRVGGEPQRQLAPHLDDRPPHALSVARQPGQQLLSGEALRLGAALGGDEMLGAAGQLRQPPQLVGGERLLDQIARRDLDLLPREELPRLHAARSAGLPVEVDGHARTLPARDAVWSRLSAPGGSMPGRFLLAALLLAATAHAKDWSVRGHGRVVWHDGGASKPLISATVKLMDADVDFDDVAASGHTNGDGRFDLSGKAGDPKVPFICDDKCSKPDLYVEVELEGGHVVVETELGFNWHADTKERSNTTGTHDFGTFSFGGTDGSHAATLFGKGIEQYKAYQAAVGGVFPRHNGKLGILFPAVLAAGVPWTTEESIHWPGGYTKFNAVYHEVGHRIRHALDGDFAHFLYDVARFKYAQHHSFDKKTNEGFAFNEGWAEYHATLLDAGVRNTFHKWSMLAGGNSVEGNVASQLTQLSDKCGGFKNMWAALHAGGIHSYKEFEAAMKKKFPSCGAPQMVASSALTRAPLLRTAIAPQTVDAQRHAVLAHVDARRVVARPVARAYLAQPAPTGPALANFQSVQRLHTARLRAHGLAVQAAHDSFRRHLLALRPITQESAANKTYLAERQNARQAFFREALGARQHQANTALQSIAAERRSTQDGAMRAHLDHVEAKMKRVLARIQHTLQQPASHQMKVAPDLLPREFAAQVAQH